MNLDLVILALIADRPHYGYEIKKYLEQYYDSVTSVNTNTLYPILRRFVDAGYAEKSVIVEAGKPNKNIYTITPEGRRKIVKELRSFSDSIFHERDACMLRLMYFDWMDKNARIRLLDGREACILETMEQTKKPHNFPKAHPIIRELGNENYLAELRAI
ncbi:MAG: PadR family transcriptional regulator [Lachnospiraceae bacterium]|nr:PadR family transcriptional regulator [Lachnospiraceae bacterium]